MHEGSSFGIFYLFSTNVLEKNTSKIRKVILSHFKYFEPVTFFARLINWYQSCGWQFDILSIFFTFLFKNIILHVCMPRYQELMIYNLQIGKIFYYHQKYYCNVSVSIYLAGIIKCEFSDLIRQMTQMLEKARCHSFLVVPQLHVITRIQYCWQYFCNYQLTQFYI